MLDLVQYLIQGIIFPILDSDPLQDHFPDQDLEISINQLNVTIVTAWVILQTIVSDVRIEILHIDNLIRLKEVITENFKRYPNYTNYRSDSRYRNSNTPQRRVNFSEPPMYLDLQTGNQR